MIIYSFDDALREPRKIHSIEVMPGGRRVALWRPVPWMGIVYFAAVELLVMALDNFVSIVGLLDLVLAPLASWVICYIAIPAGIVWLAMNAEIDGRAPHRWIVSLVRFAKRPKRTIAGRAVRAEGSRSIYRGRVRVWWDEHSPRLRRGWVRGGCVTTTVPVRFTHSLRHRHPLMRQDEFGAPTSYDVDDRLEVRP